MDSVTGEDKGTTAEGAEIDDSPEKLVGTVVT